MRPAALDAMLPWLADHVGNPSGAHRAARQARRALDDARDRLAEVVGCRGGDIVFTSGGTEADNLAIAGVLGRGAPAAADRGPALISAIEHHAVLHAAERFPHQTLPVSPAGVLDLEALRAAVSPATPLVSVMTVNNEVGTIQPLRAAAEIVREHSPHAVLHTDAVQALTFLDLQAAAPFDLLSLSAHKFGGPKGIGALVVRGATPLLAQIVGGGQERDRRSGTQNVAGAVAMSVAAWEAHEQRAETVRRIRALRDGFEAAALRLDGVAPTVAGGAEQVAGFSHLCFEGLESEALLFLLDRAGVCGSAAASCASGAQSLSHVLAAMGVPPEQARGALRFTFGWNSNEADVTAAVEALRRAVEQLRSCDRGRSLSGGWQ